MNQANKQDEKVKNEARSFKLNVIYRNGNKATIYYKTEEARNAAIKDFTLQGATISDQ